ncbi:hypothetical protein [Sphingobacterium detergens]
MKAYISFIVFAWCFISCNKPPAKFATVTDGMHYVSDSKHGFSKDTLLENGIKVKMQILPASLVQKTNNPSRKKYLSIQFSYKNRELLAQLPREEYGAYVQLFSFGMDRYIHIRSGEGKEYQANMVTYQPTYNIGKTNELLAIFDADMVLSKNLSLIISEFGLKIGQLNFSIPVDKLNYSPTIDHF